MGDRGNIVIRQGKTNRDDVWFYTHWNGSNIEEVCRTALAKGWRWSDYSYLARIVFDVLNEGQQGEECGSGISTSIRDNEHPIMVIDCPRQTVWRINEAELKDNRLPSGVFPATVTEIPFKAFAQGNGFAKAVTA